MADIKNYHQESKAGDALAFYFCGWQKCAPGHSYGPAIRPHYLFHLILSGRGVYERAGRQYRLGPGQGFLILPGESTYYIADRTDPWEYCWICFGGMEAEGILKECGFGKDNLVYEDRSGGLLQREMMALVDAFDRSNINDYMLLGRLYLSLSHMVAKNSSGKAASQEYINRALDFIHNNFGYEIGVADIAHTVGIDRTYLYRLFRRQVGQSPKEYLTKYRIHMASKMLTETNLSVTEIAFSCGFKDISLFDRRFTASRGCTPLQYRKASFGSPDAYSPRDTMRIQSGVSH